MMADVLMAMSMMMMRDAGEKIIEGWCLMKLC
jgi:hypothetical protein